MALLAAEITARTGKDPGLHYQALEARYGSPHYTRIDAPATPAQKARLKERLPEAITATKLAGEPIVSARHRLRRTTSRLTGSRSSRRAVGSRPDPRY